MNETHERDTRTRHTNETHERDTRTRHANETRERDTRTRHANETRERDTRTRHANETRERDTRTRHANETRERDTRTRHANETRERDTRTRHANETRERDTRTRHANETRERDTRTRHANETRERDTRTRHANETHERDTRTRHTNETHERDTRTRHTNETHERDTRTRHTNETHERDTRTRHTNETHERDTRTRHTNETHAVSRISTRGTGSQVNRVAITTVAIVLATSPPSLMSVSLQYIGVNVIGVFFRATKINKFTSEAAVWASERSMSVHGRSERGAKLERRTIAIKHSIGAHQADNYTFQIGRHHDPMARLIVFTTTTQDYRSCRTLIESRTQPHYLTCNRHAIAPESCVVKEITPPALPDTKWHETSTAI